MKTALNDLVSEKRGIPIDSSQDEFLDPLGIRVKEVLPQSKAISDWKCEAEGVTFSWKNGRFLVRKSLNVFELKNNRVMITGSSLLIQFLLKTREKNTKVASLAIDLLKEAETLLKQSKHSEALKLLQPLKKPLAHLARIDLNSLKPHLPSVRTESASIRPALRPSCRSIMPRKSGSRMLPAQRFNTAAATLAVKPNIRSQAFKLRIDETYRASSLDDVCRN